MVGQVPHGTSSDGVRRVVAKIEPLTGLPLVSPLEVERSVFKIGRVMVHRIPQGSSVGFSTSRSEHGSRRSCCEKTKSRLMGDPMPKMDSSYPFSVQSIRRQHVTLVRAPQCLIHQGGLCAIAPYFHFYCLCHMTHLQPTSDSL